MGPRGKKRKGKAKPQETFGSDDERTYKNEKQPDKEATDYFEDEVDEFHSNRDKILLDGVANMEPAGFNSDEKEEVLGVVSSDSDDDEEVTEYKEKLRKLRKHQHIKAGFQSESEEGEEEDEEAGLPNVKSWGNKKRRFYDADVNDDNIEFEGSGSEPEDAALEEQEALRLQKKMAEELDDDDFGLDIFKPVSKAVEKTEEKITADVSKLSRRDKLELLKKESPELLELIDDYNDKMSTVIQQLMPLNELIKAGTLPPSSGTKYIQTKTALFINYCVNVTFYLMLKAKHSPQATSHPVVKRLVQHRKLMKELEEVDEVMLPQVEKVLQQLARGQEINIAPSTTATPDTAVNSILKKVKKRAEKKRMKKALDQVEEDMEHGVADIDKGGRSWGRKRKAGDDGMTTGEREAMALYDAIRSGKKSRGAGMEEAGAEASIGHEGMGMATVEGEMDEEGKRGVTYQILKNKGLQAPKKKELRNPRVKHRMKYRKAKIRRKGQVREARTEMTRYAGELSGIRAGIKRSTKFK